MSKSYSIDTRANFLENILPIITENTDPLNTTIIFPDYTSCNLFRKLLKSKYNSLIPNTITVSNIASINTNTIKWKVAKALQRTATDMPPTTIYDLAIGFSDLIESIILNSQSDTLESIINCLDFYQTNASSLQLLKALLQDGSIASHFNCTQIALTSTLSKTSSDFFVLANIVKSSYFTAKLIEAVSESKQGILINKTHQSLNNVSRETDHKITEQILANNLYEEAFLISLATRKAIDENHSVIIVSPNSLLTQQIQKDLLRWNIISNSTLGRAFSTTNAGLLFSSVLDMISSNFSSAETISLLKLNPDIRNETNSIEHLLRSANNCTNIFSSISKLSITEKLSRIINSMLSVSLPKEASRISAWLNTVIQYADIVNEKSSSEIRKTTYEFIEHSNDLPLMNLQEFVAFYKKNIANKTCSTNYRSNSNVSIVKPIEAQLLDADLIIVASTTEQFWSISQNDTFWIPDEIKIKLNIPTDDQKNFFLEEIFEYLLAKQNILITRAKTYNNAPQIKYHHLEKYEQNHKITDALWLHNLANSIQKITASNTKNYGPPSPRPQIYPMDLYVTDIDAIVNNPYVFYSKKILKLKPLQHIRNNNSIYGLYIHKVLDSFVKQFPNNANIAKLQNIAEQTLEDYNLSPTKLGLTYFRLQRIWEFFLENTTGKTSVYSEIFGNCDLEINDDICLKIHGIADRIDVLGNGSISIIDYKTGQVPNASDVLTAKKPQLAIEAFIAEHGGFKPIGKRQASKMEFWKLSGKKEAGKIVEIAKSKEQVIEILESTISTIRSEIQKYYVQHEPYLFNSDDKYNKEYKHLARAKEFKSDT